MRWASPMRWPRAIRRRRRSKCCRCGGFAVWVFRMGGFAVLTVHLALRALRMPDGDRGRHSWVALLRFTVRCAVFPRFSNRSSIRRQAPGVLDKDSTHPTNVTTMSLLAGYLISVRPPFGALVCFGALRRERVRWLSQLCACVNVFSLADCACADPEFVSPAACVP
jgi:hypothetical protein